MKKLNKKQREGLARIASNLQKKKELQDQILALDLADKAEIKALGGLAEGSPLFQKVKAQDGIQTGALKLAIKTSTSARYKQIAIELGFDPSLMDAESYKLASEFITQKKAVSLKLAQTLAGV